MTDQDLAFVENLVNVLAKIDSASIPHTSGYYVLAHEWVPKLVAEVRMLRRQCVTVGPDMAADVTIDCRPSDDLRYDESEACE